MQGFRLSEHLPDALHTVGPFGIEAWQWAALVALIPVSFGLGILLDRPARWLALRVARRTDTAFDDALIAAARQPVILALSVGFSRALLPWIELGPAAVGVVVVAQKSLAIIAIFWVLLRAIRTIEDGLPTSKLGHTHPALRSVVPLVSRIARVLVIAAAVLTIISAFGYPVATILAGLGIGGIAVALGAQKSLEHFFGSVSIGVDQPFRVGDWVMVDGIEGTVEAIGLRSTRFRTMDRTLVTIPNGQLAESRSENFDARERIRFRTIIRLGHGTPAATVQRIRDEIEGMLRAHTLTWPNRVVVRLLELSLASLDLEVFCWVETTAVDEFRATREAHLLGILQIVERNGARLAVATAIQPL